MLQYMTARLSRRLVAIFQLQALVLIVAVGGLAYIEAKSSFAEAAFSKLEAVAQSKKALIQIHFSDLFKLMSDVQENLRFTNAIEPFSRTVAEDGIGSPAYEALYKGHIGGLTRFLDTFGFKDVYLIDPEGNVVFSVDRQSDLGENVEKGFLRASGLAQAYRRGMRGTALTDVAWYEPSKGPASFIATPLSGADGSVLGVAAFRLGSERIDTIMQRGEGLGETGETYLVGEDLLMRSNSRFGDEPTLLKRRVDTTATREALADKAGTQTIESYRGIPVLSGYSHVGLTENLGTDFEWAVVSEIDMEETFAPAKAMAIHVLLVGAALMLLAALSGYFAARSIGKPVEELSEKVARMATGDLTVAISPDSRADELGELRRNFAEMLQILRGQTAKIQEGASGLAASTAQISSTSSQLATSAAETSTAVSEIATTVEEVKQTATLSNEKGQQIAQRAADLAKVAESGQNSTGEAELGMNRISDEMQCIAESIMKLSEQTQGISEIVAAVNDLADQSNLLSVNASIEAAKAGEFGKGFAVVAQEVKTLADQSREATGQVKTILDDIQKAAGTAVMATERGNKAVAQGVEMSSRAGESISELAEGVRVSVQLATHIAASSKEQLVGIAQLADAMRGIKEATRQNLEGAKQLNDAGTSIDDLSQGLENLTTRFTV